MSEYLDKSKTFKEFYIGNYGSVFRFVRSMIYSDVETEDIVQESFFRLYKSWDALSTDDHVRAWIFCVARNLSIDRLKSSRRMVNSVPETYNSEDFILDSITLEESMRMLEAAITKLPTQTRKVALLSYIGKSNKEIVYDMGISINTVKTLKKEAYKKLRTLLGDSYMFLLALLL